MTPAEQLHGRGVIDAIIKAAMEQDCLANLTLRVPDSVAADLMPNVEPGGGLPLPGQSMCYRGVMLTATSRIKSYDMIEVVYSKQ